MRTAGIGNRTKVQLDADRRSRAIRRSIGAERRQNREDAGMSVRAVASRAGIDPAHPSRMEAGDVAARLEALSRVAGALGGELNLRFFPNTGPQLRDRVSSAIGQALLETLDDHWRRFLEVPVYRPVRGVIDLVLHNAQASLLVAIEIQSELRRLEQLIRWSNQKRDALPSSEMWAFARAQATSSLLVVRNTAVNRAIVNDHGALLSAAYPARVADVLASLQRAADWPGPALVWASVEGGKGRILAAPPRGVALGR